MIDLPLSVYIIDIGEGIAASWMSSWTKYKKIWVLDISEKDIERAKQRLGTWSQNLHWIVSNILFFAPEV